MLPGLGGVHHTTLPGIGVIRSSAYVAGNGDSWRFPNDGAAYRASGLRPMRSGTGVGSCKCHPVAIRRDYWAVRPWL